MEIQRTIFLVVGFDCDDVAKFAKRSGIVILTTAKAADFRSPVSRDGMLLQHLQIPEGDPPAFLTRSVLDGELNNSTRVRAAASYLGDFLPAHPKKFREGRKDLTGGNFLNVLVGKDSPEKVMVYLKWFGT